MSTQYRILDTGCPSAYLNIYIYRSTVDGQIRIYSKRPEVYWKTKQKPYELLHEISNNLSSWQV